MAVYCSLYETSRSTVSGIICTAQAIMWTCSAFTVFYVFGSCGLAAIQYIIARRSPQGKRDERTLQGTYTTNSIEMGLV